MRMKKDKHHKMKMVEHFKFDCEINFETISLNDTQNFILFLHIHVCTNTHEALAQNKFKTFLLH